MAHRALADTFKNIGIAFESLEELVGEERLILLENFLERTTSSADKKIYLYCMKLAYDAHEGDVRVTTGSPYIKHPVNAGIATLEEEWGDLRNPLICATTVHDVPEAWVDKEYKNMSEEQIESLFQIEKQRMTKEGNGNLFRELEEQGVVEEILKERTVKMRLREDCVQKFSRELHAMLEPKKIGRQGFTRQLVRVVDKLSRYGTFNESYPRYLINLCTPQRPLAPGMNVDQDSLLAAAVKIYERTDSINEMAGVAHEAHHAIYPRYDTMLRAVFNPQDKTEYLALKEKIRSLVAHIDKTPGNSFSGQKWLYECAKNNLVLPVTRAFFGGKRFMYRAQLLRAEQKLIAATYDAADTHRLKLLVLEDEFDPPENDRLKGLVEEYRNREGFSGMSEEFTGSNEPGTEFRIFDNTLGTYIQMMRKDRQGFKEQEATEKNKEFQFQDTHAFIGMLDYLKDPNAKFNIETKITYDEKAQMYVPTDEKIAW